MSLQSYNIELYPNLLIMKYFVLKLFSQHTSGRPQRHFVQLWLWFKSFQTELHLSACHRNIMAAIRLCSCQAKPSVHWAPLASLRHYTDIADFIWLPTIVVRLWSTSFISLAQHRSKILIVAAPQRKFINFAGGSYSSTLEDDLTCKHPLWCKIIEFGIMLSHPSAFWEISHVSLSCISSLAIVACFLFSLVIFLVLHF